MESRADWGRGRVCWGTGTGMAWERLWGEGEVVGTGMASGAGMACGDKGWRVETGMARRRGERGWWRGWDGVEGTGMASGHSFLNPPALQALGFKSRTTTFSFLNWGFIVSSVGFQCRRPPCTLSCRASGQAALHATGPRLTAPGKERGCGHEPTSWGTQCWLFGRLGSFAPPKDHSGLL